jgi:hypothetical protein
MMYLLSFEELGMRTSSRSIKILHQTGSGKNVQI